jgi:rare lipoprotein A
MRRATPWIRRSLVVVMVLSVGCSASSVRPEKKARVFTQTGKASFYANMFQGRTTANGEIFDQNKMTAAHRTLAFGTKVRVTNLTNKKSVVVTINDRGPYIDGRIIDLSRKAAKQIDLIGKGIAPCKVEVLKYPLVETRGPGGNG